MIIGHKNQWEFLKKIIEIERIPQAMLFCGQEHLGKKRVALEFVKLLNCEKRETLLKNKIGDAFPCQTCLSCVEIEKGTHPDVYFIRPQKKEIQISQIRNLKKDLMFHPFRSAFKSVIIDNAESLNLEAQNCLLKILEEPNQDTLFILISSHPEALLETIRSRTQILKFYPLSASEIEESFKENISASLRDKLIFFSEGRPGKMKEFFKNPERLTLEIGIYEMWQKILNSDLPQRFSLIKELSEREDFAENLPLFLEILVRYLRIILLRKLKVEKIFFFSALQIPKKIEEYSLMQLKTIIEKVENLKGLIERSYINPKLALENLMLSI